MKTLLSPLFIICAIGGLALSTVITVDAWNIQIEPRAFQCWDGPGLGACWVNMDDHRGAGDKISPGWTWEGIKMWQKIYMGAFFAIWVSSSIVSFRLMSEEPARDKWPHPTAAPP